MSEPNEPSEPGPPPNLRRGRQALLIAFLQGALGLVAVLGVAALVVPEPVHHSLAVAMVVVLVAVPVIRVVWLVLRWIRRRDWRFVAAGTGLLAVLAVGLILAT